MKFIETSIKGLIVIEPKVHGDHRGYFYEAYRDEFFEEAGLPTKFRQDNQAKSSKNVLRGLHYQLKHPQGKLVRATLGSVFDIAVDLRRNSPTFGKNFGLELSAENFKMMFVPEGFAHGYCVLSETAIFQYKTTDIYHPEDEYGLLWNDPALGLDWLIQDAIISEKDKVLPLLKDINPEHLF